MSHTCDIIIAEYINLGFPAGFWLSPSLQLPLQTLASFEVEHHEGWRAVEQVSGLRNESIKDIAWIKPIHLCAAGQRTAIAIFKLASQEDANKVIRDGLYVEGKKVWGRKQVQEPRRCLKCQCYEDHKATECWLIHKVCGRCGDQHRTSKCSETDRSCFSCSNCKAASNDKHAGHGTINRRCPIFLSRIEKMNKARSDNTYKFYCTADPKTWETHETNAQEPHVAETNKKSIGYHEREEKERARGRLARGNRGDGGGFQKVSDKGWEGMKEMKAGMRTGGNRVNGNLKAEDSNNSNMIGSGLGNRVKDPVTMCQLGGRKYKLGVQKDAGSSQMTLNRFWTGKEKDLWSWSEEMEELDQLDIVQAKGSQESALSYV